jgi:hypothetical protein
MLVHFCNIVASDFSHSFPQTLYSTPNRSLGPAELLLEASFTDLRHGGDGNLRRAYVLAKLVRNMKPVMKFIGGIDYLTYLAAFNHRRPLM